MISNIRRIAAAAAVTGVVAGASALTAGVATANPSDVPCTADDVTIAVTKDPGSGAGHEAFRIDYTAAGPHTNCKLQGAPTDVVFGISGRPLPGVEVTTTGDAANPVNLTASSPAHSYLIQELAAEPNATVPSSIDFTLPSADGSYARVAWPADGEIKNSLQATPVYES
ncbi:DUF4232 domain-containing protein [Saccharopolyspora sp. MS10]|uniref:DUF4232 domain-containing protein n=1 Tax=Saccharopolyspora sp. MS10 TaxID=3385973 RepID=UPI0039A23EFE